MSAVRAWVALEDPELAEAEQAAIALVTAYATGTPVLLDDCLNSRGQWPAVLCVLAECLAFAVAAEAEDPVEFVRRWSAGVLERTSKASRK